MAVAISRLFRHSSGYCETGGRTVWNRVGELELRRTSRTNTCLAPALTLLMMLILSARLIVPTSSALVFDHFTMTGYPSSTVAGASFVNGIVVTARDASEIPVTDYVGQVYFTSTDSQAILPYTSGSKYTFTTGDNGVHTFAGTGFKLKTAGSQNITIRNGTISEDSSPITVNATAASKLIITLNATSITAGSWTSKYTVQRQDPYGNPVTSGSTILNLVSTSTGANKKFAASSGGPAVTTVTIPDLDSVADFFYYDEKAGTWTISVSATGLIGDSKILKVDPVSLDHFSFNTISNPQVVNLNFSITIRAQDQYDNTVTSYTSQNTLSTSAGSGTISPTSTGGFTSGSWTGFVTINETQPGGLTLNITTSGGGKSGTSNSFNVNPVVQVSMTISYSIIGGGSGYSAPLFNYVRAEKTLNQSLTTTGTSVSVDLGSPWYVTPNPLSGSSSSERWYSPKSTSGVASAQTVVLSYYHQFTQTTPVPSGSTMTVGSCDFGLSAIVKTFTGRPQVTLAAYPQNPQGAPSFTPLGKYVQVKFSSRTGVIETEIRVCYPASITGLDQSTFKVYWWGGGTWQACSISNVNLADKYAWARITPNTTPNLAQLEDALFVGGGESGAFIPPSPTTTPSGPPTSSPLYPPPTATPTWGVPSKPTQKLCIIATATYGSEMAPEVVFMRHVRDDMIGSNEVGRSIVNGWNTFYYSWSAPLAQLITTHSNLQPGFRVLLLPLLGTIHATASIYNLTALVNLTLASIIAFLFAAIASTAIYILIPLLTIQTMYRKRFNLSLKYR